jgi:anaerobic dimethyl sulfoxide reductase subunit B (iron-sulfur subunit)
MQWHDILPGSVRWMRVHQWEKGVFPNVRLHMLPVMCYHCENPVCAKACPHGAIQKEEKYGAVLVKPDQCQGSRKCWQVCPYGAPQLEGDGPGKKMSKCTMCIDRLEQGLKPICVLSCSMRALEFGPLDEIIAKYGNLRRLEDMPRETTQPAAVFKPSDPKGQVVPWDHERALALWAKRESADGEPLPDIFTSSSEVTGAPHQIVGRNRLVLKPRNAEELTYYTTDDE